MDLMEGVAYDAQLHQAVLAEEADFLTEGHVEQADLRPWSPGPGCLGAAVADFALFRIVVLTGHVDLEVVCFNKRLFAEMALVVIPL